MSRRSLLPIAVLVLLMSLAGAVAEVIQCSPVSEEDQRLYDDWGAEQSPPLEYLECLPTCEHGLRKCFFRERTPSISEQRHLALCNGRDKGPPCQMFGPVEKSRGEGHVTDAR